ncbi:hypothetical protein [Micromonospora tarapacensis]|uniref:hypothetical protein n=1 Tax=Micromonospora tarapacensis TaxID=2835305 RepID=UPI002F42F545
MAEEDQARATDRGGSGRHRDPATRRPAPGREGATRASARRLDRARRRRRGAVETVAAVAGLLALVGYVNWWSEPTGEDPAEPDGLPAVVGRPSLPSNQPTGQAVPGLRPRERSPSPSPTPASPSPPAVPVSVSVSRVDIPATVDLTESGERDWVHWGLGGDRATVRKRDGSAEIRDLGGRGERRGWDGNQEMFRWRDGAPVRSVDATPDGVYTCGVDSGFTLAVTTDGRYRTATVYLGVWMARGRLEARLTGGPSRTLRLEERHTSRSAGATIRFRAPEGGRLLLTWTVEESFTRHCGNVGLQAVALR